MTSFLRLFLSWWGALLLSFFDSTLVTVLPFGIDALLVYLAARNAQIAWVYPLMMTAGSTAGAALTYWIGHVIGDAELPRLVPRQQLARLKQHVHEAGAGKLAVVAVLPPPFPLTPFVLTSGALGVDRKRFFSLFAGMRLVRFAIEAMLARRYGDGVLRVLRSDVGRMAIAGLIVVAVAATVVSGVVLWRRTRHAPRPA